jgi:hypothetical protein
MKTKISAILVGTGAAVNIGLGFVPDRVQASNLSAASLPTLEWARGDRATTVAPEGLYSYQAGDYLCRLLLGAAAGVKPYVAAGAIADGTASYLVRADLVEAFRGDMRAKTGTLVSGWTLEHTANKTGKFNAGVDTTYVGVGSQVCIGGQWATIIAITNDGDATNEVTLDTALPTGTVEKILYKSGFATAPAGTLMPDGITLSDTSVNASGALVRLEASQYEF